jgi:hypothetical protein
VDVPELHETFTLQGMNGLQRDAFESALVTGVGRRRTVNTQNIRAKLLVQTIIDPMTGELLFSEADADALGQVRADVLDRLFTVAQRLSGVSDKDVEELGKK